ncbi:alpha-ketoacid dehydrogenase subunit alpha/beta [Fluviispira multicolorata]|uniref:3-methyl-2-oxobutanoate dehydrogenase (2-methylpropanoyl-transferring) n=1 Tax=Fluviispira multicolorata TaxID=2654512 RepID=A0A833JH67_9BACT|nr:alpha-ketoacid dehydrogenase subunit alpha/beta [Fluviispira multicolorata]KAB8033358.1 transketolase [Fluviispira multicolorata]
METNHVVKTPNGKYSFSFEEILNDFRIAIRSRIASVVGRKEVLTGKASFGIFGDGIELPQIAVAKAFLKGDFRTGYYRDQTFEMAIENVSVIQFFSQLYADIKLENEPNSGGRQMNAHFASRLLDEDGRFKNQLESKNSISDISPTAGQMSRMLGLAYASKIYRNNKKLEKYSKNFSKHGNEVVFGSIGDASTSEGVFFEAMNAAGVLQVPLVMSVWDNGYGISVPRELQTVNNSISKALAGFSSEKAHEGISIYKVEGWDYLKLCETYLEATEKSRKDHKPALIHVTELTQPQGHSTSGSHERYKSKDRLEWEKEYCCLKKFREWILDRKITTSAKLDKIEDEEKLFVEQSRKKAWNLYLDPIKEEKSIVLTLLSENLKSAQNKDKIKSLINKLENSISLNRRYIHSILFKALLILSEEETLEKNKLIKYYEEYAAKFIKVYENRLYSESSESPLEVKETKPIYSEKSEMVDGRVILQRCFDQHFTSNAKFFAIGEDVGKLGDVNLVFEGLNAKYGDLRVTDTGIRESTILGQGIGAAIRGLRPIVDIQYLDYFLYAIQTASDDLATLHYRTAGGQKAPVIIRTKGHRLEGIWHTGSPMAMLLSTLRGIYICVPRNMTQAAGMYNTLLQSDNPAVVIEVLNAYRLKEKVPENISTYTVSLGVPEIIRAGRHLTVVTYGACCKIALDAAEELESFGISVEIIDVQTLLPFDISGIIAKSIKKTNAVLFFDEDVPGGASAYMMQQTLEKNNAFHYLDCMPRTLTATENRGAFGRDGDYYCKPQIENVFEVCYKIMREREPKKYRDLFTAQKKIMGASSNEKELILNSKSIFL